MPELPPQQSQYGGKVGFRIRCSQRGGSNLGGNAGLFEFALYGGARMTILASAHQGFGITCIRQPAALRQIVEQ